MSPVVSRWSLALGITLWSLVATPYTDVDLYRKAQDALARKEMPEAARIFKEWRAEQGGDTTSPELSGPLMDPVSGAVLAPGREAEDIESLLEARCPGH